jgi:hypothetical protein
LKIKQVAVVPNSPSRKVRPAVGKKHPLEALFLVQVELYPKAGGVQNDVLREV